MSRLERFEDMKVWQTARQMTHAIYDISSHGSFAKDFALRDQLRRAAISVMSNVAEGFESRTRGLFVDFVGRAKASAGEVRCQLYIALDAGHIGQDDFDRLASLAISCSSQLSGLITYLTTHRVSENLHEYNS